MLPSLSCALHRYNASANIGPDKQSVVLTAVVPNSTPKTLTIAATRFGWNLFPINTIKSAEGLPLMPWYKNVTAADSRL
jgi:hypothetical protein